MDNNTQKLQPFKKSLDVSRVSVPVFHELEEPEKKPLEEIIKIVRDGYLGIPLFQRDFVWTRRDIEELFESILRGYYVGSLLFWSVNRDPEIKVEPVYGTGVPEEKLKPRYIVLDGQQRISSIFYATTAPNLRLWNTKQPYVFFIDLEKLLESDNFSEPVDFVISMPKSQAERRGLFKPNEQFQNWYFPIFKFENFHDWLDEFEEFLRSRQDFSQEKVLEIKRRLRGFLRQVWEKFEIPIIKLPQDMQLVDVAKIFEKLNSTGVLLTVFDLLNARMVKHNIRLRELWDNARDSFPLIKQFSEGNERLPVYVLQTVALLRDKSTKSSELLKLESENFEADWKTACQAIEHALKKITSMRDGYGVISNKWLPYVTMVPVLANLLQRLEARFDKLKCIEKINSWYWSSIITHAYSGSTDTQIALDSRQLMEWFVDDNKVPETVQEGRDELRSLNLRQVNRMSDAIYKGVMCLVALRGGRDFRKVNMIEFSTLDDHHIFPQSRASEFGAGNQINAIGNKTLIDKETNQNYIRDSKPSEYLYRIIRQEGITEQQMRERLETHLITSKAFDALLSDDFETFISERENTIKEMLSLFISKP